MAEGTRNAELRKELDLFRDKVTADNASINEQLTSLRQMIAAIAINSSGENSNGGGNDRTHAEQQRSSYQMPTKCSSVEFPKFNGEDLRGWIYRCEQFFEVDDTPSEAKVRMVAVHLEGRALQWHQVFMKTRLTRELPRWPEYVRALHNRFGLQSYDDPMSELVNLKQTGSVQDYLDSFEELVNCVELTEQYAVSCFLGGLRPEIAVAVRMFRPNTLSEAVGLSKLQEQAHGLASKRIPTANSFGGIIKPNVSNTRAPFTPNVGNPSRITGHGSLNHGSSSITSASFPSKSHNIGRGGNQLVIPSRRLSPQEMDDKRARGLCSQFRFEFLFPIRVGIIKTSHDYLVD